jgi:hypothetical protein
MKIGIYHIHESNGPGKVVLNLKKGLEQIGIDYLNNEDGDVNIILQECDRLYHDVSNCFVGPNVCVIPSQNTVIMGAKYKKTIVPSEWVKNLYLKWLPSNLIEIWPVGIDTDFFSDKSNDNKEYDFLIYFKRRNQDELNFITTFLNNSNLNYVIINYGDYSEEIFLDSISKSKRGIVIDSSESQGIAIEEMMSCNLPLLVWDVKKWEDMGVNNSCESTSIPYWDETCGEYFFNKDEFLEKFKKFMSCDTYRPRNYILENLSLSKSAEILSKIIN